MADHLLAISIGPIQDFIAAARRTRDLWYGSDILSRLSKAVAKSVREQGGNLIFPAPECDEELEPESPLPVANNILAVVSTENPKKLTQNANEALRKAWLEEVNKVRENASGFVDKKRWKAAEKEDVLEFFAAWVETTNNHREDRKKVMRLLAGRKACRNFEPAPGDDRKIPKSSLDGRRPSLLKETSLNQHPSSAELRLNKGEQLDLLGVIKRTATEYTPYPSVARVAVQPWVEKIVNQTEKNKHVADAFQTLKETAKDCGLPSMDANRFRQFNDFLYDGTTVFLSRHEAIAEEEGLTGEQLNKLNNAVKKLTKPELKLGQPSPYLAILVADGDHMGRAISTLQEIKSEQKLSKCLSKFSQSVSGIVQSHKGFCVYAGGDDVLAFLPINTCLECARKLHDTFAGSFTNITEVTETPTLSAGIAIAHFMEPMEDLLNYGRKSEKMAKASGGNLGANKERNGLAICIHPRSGSSLGVREQWGKDGDSNSLDKRIMTWRSEGLPEKLPYDLRESVQHWKEWDTSDHLKEAIPLELKRLLKKKQIKSEKLLEVAGTLTTPSDVERLANELLVAQWLTQETAKR
jgi:CRISPR-associated protein Cmr2